MAVEKAKARGLDVEMVVVGDDVGVGRKKGGKVGRRGIAGTALVQKIAGALAATGAPLKDVYGVAKLSSENLVSVGASLSHVHVPGRTLEDPNAGEALSIEEVEIGMGIHNEPGYAKVKMALPELVTTMLKQLLDQSDKDRAFLKIAPEDEVVLLINNLGGVSPLELGGITAEVATQLDKDYEIKPVRVLSGTFMTSLNGLGFSITILKLVDTGLGQGRSMLELLDAPAEATGWQAAVSPETWSEKFRHNSVALDEEPPTEPTNLRVDRTYLQEVLASGLNRLIEAEPDITTYDTIAGDGDCGIGLRRGAESILKYLEKYKGTDDIVVALTDITRIVETSMDGTSGALYAIFLNALANGLRLQSPSSPSEVTPAIWGKGLKYSLNSLAKYTPARPGDRTLVDALDPFVETLIASDDPKKAADAARKGAENTKGMVASLGRTVYVGGEGWQGVPDPGAHGLSQFLTGLVEGLSR
ncbi:DAK1/DegV-like protein [Xylona heveae TC161]|uniref:DAK1/DegV-like protein n=1 Tax=Xylona heveae (strain CBS 132557 / TC161) TaxID=1328760 RepID=A0A165JUC8_XYLHT|nr:DAK1/DegV-like protein [Xylona heveae TC161]KZF26640.1 DAK1/DegV-like protein [Xylona heveae TC161]